MDKEDKSTLRKILELEQKNSRILSQMQRSMFWGRVFKTIYWVFIIAAAIGAYYYVEPSINHIIDAYGGFKGDIKNIFQ